MQDYFFQPKPATRKKSHYYGDNVRQLFLAGGILILIFMPIYNNILPIGAEVATSVIVILALAAGMTTFKERWIIIFDTLASMLFLVVFESYAVLSYRTDSVILFSLRQVIAIIFLFALYYSAKTLRAMYLNQIDE